MTSPNWRPCNYFSQKCICFLLSLVTAFTNKFSFENLKNVFIEDAYNDDNIIIKILIDTSETFRVIYGLNEAITQLLITFVRWQIQAVEACMGPGVAIGIAPFFNSERLRSIASIQLFESIHGYPRRACHKL